MLLIGFLTNVSLTAQAAQDTLEITEVEYFFDDDPGYGNATSVLVGPDSVINIVESITSASLETGFHSLYFRARNLGILEVYNTLDTGSNIVYPDSLVAPALSSTGQWGLTESRMVYVDNSGIGELVGVSDIEVFIDTDPGVGNGASVTPFTASNNISILETITTDTLSTGFHTLFLRAQSSGGKWGVYESRLFYVDPSGVGNIIEVSDIEVFIDNDPGVGNGTVVTSFTSSNSVSIQETIRADTLSNGFHTLYVRAQASGGTWGVYESRMFYVDPSGVGDIIEVSDIEIFIDSDPGVGNGASVTPFTVSNEISIIETMETDTLSTGFHSLYIRAQVSGGRWGVYESRLFYVDPSGVGSLVEVTDLEYFLDNDPGYGNGTSVASFTPGNMVSLIENISTDTLSFGFHTLYVRAQGSGGNWGSYESRLVYLDQSGAGNLLSIADIEFFIDSDPGYGNGAKVTTFSSLNSVSLIESIATDTMNNGFHTLYIRAMVEGGQWGTYESRLFYLDHEGIATLIPVNELEYFIDVDPGYGAGTSIPIAPPSFEAFRDFAVATNSLGDGHHEFGLRAKNENGDWGMVETRTFTAFGEGRELDSVTLRLIYKEMEGSGWSNDTNWLTAAIDNWFGVTVMNDRVDSLSLPANNLVGSAPSQMGYLTNLKKLDLSGNSLTDTIPSTWKDLVVLEELYLHDNELVQFPDLSSITTLNAVALDSNYFDFGDLEPLAGLSNYTYANQQFTTPGFDTIVRVGHPITIDLEVAGSNNNYQWMLNDQPIPFQDLVDIELASFMATDTGSYQLQVTNSLITDLELRSNLYNLNLNNFDEDSLALVSLYNATSGSLWTNNTGWLTDPVGAWSGVTLANNRVVEIALEANNLAGMIPPDLSYADSVLTLNLSANSLLDTFPASIADSWKHVESIDISGNRISDIPAFNGNSELQTLNVSTNRLQFGAIESNLGIPSFNYSPQDSISTFSDTLLDLGQNLALGFEVSGANNTYQWYKNNQTVGSATSNPLEFTGLVFADEGVYRLEINNTLATGLTLSSGEFLLKISSLTRDSIALKTIYDAMGGDNWTADINWLDEPITNWDSISISNQRVVSFSMKGSNISGALPKIVRDITSLESLNLSGNEITSIPNMSQMPNLGGFDVSDNRLGFAEIIPNLSIDNFTFDPQKLLGNPVSEIIPVGTAYDFGVKVSGGNNNLYQWSLNGLPIANVNKDTFRLESIEYDSMGVYSVEVTNPLVSGFSIESNEFKVLASADLDLVTLNQNNDPIAEATGYALLVRAPGQPYDTVQVVSGSGDEIIFEDLILADYLISVEGDPELYLPTYYINTDLWTEADTLELRDNTTETLKMTPNPDALPPKPDGASIEGTVESDFAEDNGGRIDARRKVKRAGCSVRRFTRGGRTDQEDGKFVLYAYVQSDDEGRFEFTDLDFGLYRFNIEYPGIPMDENSFVEFEFEEGVENNKLILQATITETGIVVEKIDQLGFYRKYFRDLSVYPNPANDYLRITYDKLMSETVTVRLVDLEGNVLKEQEVRKGYDQSFDFDVREYKQGVYILNFIDRTVEGQSISTFKVFISRQ